MIEARVDGGQVPREEVDTWLRAPAGLLWVDAVSAGAEEVDWLAQRFRLHPLVVEDLTHRNQRPKVDDYESYLFVVLMGVASSGAGGHPQLAEVHLVAGSNFLLTVSDVEVPALRALFHQCDRRPDLASRTVGMLFYRVCDSLVDSFFPVLDGLDDAIDSLETNIIERADESVVENIFTLKRDLNTMRRVLGPERDLTQALAGPHGPLLGTDAQLYLRDVYDHTVRIVEQVDSYRDVVTGALDVYLSSVSNRLGEQTQRLSIVATIFLPLTFFTGFFGQNFAFLVNHISTTRAFAFGMTAMVFSVLVIWFVVRRTTAAVRPVARSGAERRPGVMRPYTRLRVRRTRSMSDVG